MSYSTPDQFRAFVDRAAGQGGRSVNLWGQSGAGQDENIQLALSAASATLDAAAQEGGFQVPLTQSSLGVTDEQWAKNLARLQVCEMALAIGHNLFPAGLTEQMKDVQESCKSFLADLRRGRGLLTSSINEDGRFQLITTAGTPTIDFETLSASFRRPSL